MSRRAASTFEGQENMLLASECPLLYDFLYDSHCHLRRISPSAPATAVPGPLTSVSGEGGPCNCTPCTVTGLVLCGTHPSIDRDAIAQTSAKRAATLIGFGVHPWSVPNATSSRGPTSFLSPVNSSGGACRGSSSSGAETNANLAAPGAVAPALPTIFRLLGERLEQRPSAIVAEIGLDKLRGPPESVQVEAFAAQLRLAAAYRRPICAHCARHYGVLLQVLRDLPAEHTPPAIILHRVAGGRQVAAGGAAAPARDTAAAADSSSATPKRIKRGGATAEVVRIKDFIFFGVGVSTSFAVKNFAAQTLPFLLETDEHYSGIEAQAAVSAAEFHAEAETQLSPRSRYSVRVRVDPQEHITKLAGVLERVHAVVLESRGSLKKAEASSVSAEVVLRDALLHAYSVVFRSVSEETGALGRCRGRACIREDVGPYHYRQRFTNAYFTTEKKRARLSLPLRLACAGSQSKLRCRAEMNL
ncbi:hypothetical protein CUR178_00438 [Leishmania enriettii]|uniref:TatD related DNase n=1 Tax=Leishmania enriettii TaxID=5663 RepID=A0A836K9X9_LEIEN|nr:hypothetical protein CUR178_00438 [Leishmania enriettii]